MQNHVVMLNARQEKFCQWVASGKPDVEAYRLAGYSPDSAESNASRLRENEGVAARIEELQAANASHFALTREAALELLAEIACTPIGEITEQSRICQEKKETPGEFGTTITLKMPGKVEALKLAAAMNGWLSADQAANKQAGALASLAELLREVQT